MKTHSLSSILMTRSNALSNRRIERPERRALCLCAERRKRVAASLHHLLHTMLKLFELAPAHKRTNENMDAALEYKYGEQTSARDENAASPSYQKVRHDALSPEQTAHARNSLFIIVALVFALPGEEKVLVPTFVERHEFVSAVVAVCQIDLVRCALLLVGRHCFFACGAELVPNTSTKNGEDANAACALNTSRKCVRVSSFGTLMLDAAGVCWR